MNIGILRCWFVCWAICLMTGWSQVSDDFEDGNDDGWTHLNPLADFGGKATFSFPGGEIYRFQVGASPDAETLGQARGGSLRADIDHTAFRVSVDVVAVGAGLEQDVGILARVSSPGLGTLNGYSASIDTDEGLAYLSRLDGEQPTVLGTSVVTLDMAKDYRIVFHGYGGQFLIEVFDMADLTTTIDSVAGFDDLYADGSAGLFGSAAQGDGTADVTFDNFGAGVNPDTDQDGMSDPMEADVWGDLSQHGGGDYDGDGRSNADELNAGTDPEVADSEFLLRSFFADEYVVLVTFRTFVGVTYLLETSVDLENWTVDASAVFTDLGDGVGEIEADKIEADKNDGTQFIRVTAGGD